MPASREPPYCCNGCIELYGYGCTHPYHFYDAKAAHEKATDRKVTSRMGIDCTPEELAATTAIVKKGLAQGQSIRHIFAANEGKMCCSWRTYYDYVEDGLIEDDFTVGIDVDAQDAWLQEQGVSTVDMSEQEIKEANTGTMYSCSSL